MRGFYAFVERRSKLGFTTMQASGRRVLVKAVERVDRALAEVAESFDFLLQVTPVNMEEAWHAARRQQFGQFLEMRYRPLPVDPLLLKRRLFSIPVERVEDPTVERLFREKLLELDRQLTMLADIGTGRFLHGSIQLYGTISEQAMRVAEAIIERLAPEHGEDDEAQLVSAEEFAGLARQEIAWYRRQYSGFRATATVRRDIYAGLLVSHGHLLIGRRAVITRPRVRALVCHEIGTHSLTYFNGRAQPLRLLSVGLAGYDELQEGLAVLAEYLVGGLSRARLRLLAGRVIAAQAVTDGADYVETFRKLTRECGFAEETAFTVATRVHRGGGLTKDAVYLRGILHILDYLRSGGELEPLYFGKIAVRHVPLINELQWRGTVLPAPLRPRFLDLPEARERIANIRQVASLYDLLA